MTFLKEESYGTVKAFFLSSAVWFVIGTSIGFIDAIHLVAPDLLGNISWLVFGRTRPMHTNLVIFGFIGTALLGRLFIWCPPCCDPSSIASGWENSPCGSGI